jgi:UDP-N-acetyl-alpha-D-quinovosamine dehydrogenase
VAVKRALPATVLVTGAGGFLGSHVCAALVERRVAVRALVRRPDAPLAPGAFPVMGDLEDSASLRRAVAGVAGVIHLAAHVHGSSADPEAIGRVNVDATVALLEAAAAAGVRDFLFASSVKAVGESNEAPWTEAATPAPADPYGRSKLEAEGLVREAAARHGLHAPILRLPLVYGPGMKANALRLFQLVDRGVPLPFGSMHNRRSLLFTGNMLAALIATIESPEGSDTFFVSDDEDLSTPRLVTAVARALGRPARLVPVPVGLLRAAGLAGDLVSRLVPFPLTTAAVERLAGSLAVDCSRLKRLTSYAPLYSVAEAMTMTARWYRRRGSARAA